MLMVTSRRLNGLDAGGLEQQIGERLDQTLEIGAGGSSGLRRSRSKPNCIDSQYWLFLRTSSLPLHEGRDRAPNA